MNTITGKVVLILGRLTPERKSVLDAIRVDSGNKTMGILFDFEKSE